MISKHYIKIYPSKNVEGRKPTWMNNPGFHYQGNCVSKQTDSRWAQKKTLWTERRKL
jgi:hypothetical protein